MAFNTPKLHQAQNRHAWLALAGSIPGQEKDPK